MPFENESLAAHEKHRGKLEIRSKVPLRTRKDLALFYTPGVGAVAAAIAKDPMLAYKYTIKSNTVAIVSDGSAVLGLGNVGAYAAIPVMEGKAVLFKEFAGIDAFPICLEEFHDDFIEDVKNIAPVFGGINLEDIAAPRCFLVEERLQDIGIPVMHDDQHGTAIVVLAGLLNAMRVLGREPENQRIVINGAGAAGTAIARILQCISRETGICREFRDIIVCDSRGIIHRGRTDLNPYKEELAKTTNKSGIKGTLGDALLCSDVFIGVSKGGLLTGDMVRTMNPGPVIFALANPVPEIMPELALAAGASVVATGRSDFANQINNVLAFPGVFRGALDAHATTINSRMKIAAALALSNYVKNPSKEMIIPDILDKKVTVSVAEAVSHAAVLTGVVRRP